MPQFPPEQTPVLQTVPHLPQLLVSVLRLISQPFTGLPSQSAKPALHDVIWQAPFTHFGLSLVRFASQPSPNSLLQSPNPMLHMPTVQPMLQPPAPLATMQLLPQPRQLSLSPLMSTSHPLATIWSQSANPALHFPTVHF